MRPVAFAVPAEVAFDYLVEPRNRPQWQSSLRRVVDVQGIPGRGQRWVDVTAAGVRPQMETTLFDRPRRWSERGTWRGVEATLTLSFAPRPGGCTVGAEFTVGTRGVARPLGPVLRRAAGPAVRADLRRAARILSEGRREH